MQKLKLKLEDLRIDSFSTTAVQREKGTIFGEQCTCYTNCTCPGCPTCDASCNGTCAASCNGTCDATCNTCAPSCNGTCYVSCNGTCGQTCNGGSCWGTCPDYSGCTPYACP